MRTRSIISVLRNRSTVRKTSSRIKHTEALKSLKALSKNGYELLDIIDNKLTPFLASPDGICHDCGKRIRWEYNLKVTSTNKELIVGSSCVWVLMELSPQEIKEFQKAEASIKAHHRFLEWKRTNKDVYDKLMTLKKANVWFFIPFINEIEYCPLNTEDTEYIRGIDLEHELSKQADKDKGRSKFSKVLDKTTADMKAKASAFEKDPKYRDTITKLKSLIDKYPKDDFLMSALIQVNSGRLLTENQIYKIKALQNKEYYHSNIKDTKDEKLYKQCDTVIISLFRDWVDNKDITIYFLDIAKVNTVARVYTMVKKYRKAIDKKVKESKDDNLIKYWKFFRIKNEILL